MNPEEYARYARGNEIIEEYYKLSEVFSGKALEQLADKMHKELNKLDNGTH